MIKVKATFWRYLRAVDALRIDDLHSQRVKEPLLWFDKHCLFFSRSNAGWTNAEDYTRASENCVNLLFTGKE